MKAKLIVKDICGLKGEHTFELTQGKVNLIEASNSSGKSSLIKALAGILSIPKDGNISDDQFLYREAKRIGLTSDEKNPQKGFVNVHSDKGSVSLEFNDIKDKYVVKQNGQHIELPEHGESKFLLAGILSNETKILRQLNGLEEDYEPDNFNWAVLKLSLASNYDEIRDILLTKREDATEAREYAKRRFENIGKLERELNELKKKSENLDKELGKLDKLFRGDLFIKRKDLLKKINEIEEVLGSQRGELNFEKNERDKIEKEFQNLLKEIKKVDEEYSTIDIESLEKEKIKIEKEVSEEVESKINERNSISGLLNLYMTAQTSLRGENKTITCPLCKHGKINKQDITKELELLRKNIDKVNGEILNLNQEIRSVDQKLEKARGKKQELRDERNDLEVQKKLIEKDKLREKNF